MRKFFIFSILVFVIGAGFPTYVLSEVAPQASDKQDKQKELKALPGFDIRKEMIKRGEITFPTQPRVGLKASHVPESSTRAASRLAALPGKQFVKHFYINWGPRNLPRSILNFMRPLTDADTRTPQEVSKSFLKQHQELFKLSSAEVDNTITEKNYKTKHNGARHVVLLQAVDNIPVYKGRMSFHYNRQGQLVLMNIGDVVPGLSISTVPSLNEVQAVRAAVSSMGKSLPAEPVLMTPRAKKENIAILKNPFGGKINLRLMIFPIGNSGRLAWWIQLDLQNGREWYEMLIDANTGELLYRNNLYVNTAHGRVFKDNPSRGGSQYLEFPAAWLGGTETEGNNVDAYEDHDGDNTTPGNRAVSTAAAPNQDFNFTWGDGLTNQNPLNFTDAAITNLFYFVNLYHDYTYDLGFDEAAGNFQEDNFGLGDPNTDQDRVLAEAQDSGALNNAYFGTPVDGSNPRMQVGLANRGTPLIATDDLDRDVNGDTIFHENTHGLSNRLVGGPTTTSCLPWNPYEQGGAMGEGWGDFIACNFFNDPVYGEYQSQNFTSGLRGAAYDNQPRTYSNADMTHGAHSDGEIWGAALWDLREALRAAYGADVGRQMVAQLVVDGMKLTPCHPSFIDGRNAILMADQLTNGGTNKCLIWEVFADRGMGIDAEGDATFTHNADFNTSPACETPRDPVDIVLVLDHSGSMDDPAPGGTQDKIDLLKDAVELFIRGWTPYAVAGDKIGVVYFESSVTQYNTPLLIDFLGNEQNVINDVRAHNPESSTAMGGGLQTAINELVSSANAKKHIILFTDGMQNCSPMVRELAPDGTPPEPNHDIRDEPIDYLTVFCNSGVAGAPGVSLESYLTNNNTRIHTIGTGVSGIAWQNLLTNIANETDGENHFTSEPDLELFRFYEEDLVTSLAGNTLELVKYKTAVMNKGEEQRTEKFTINTAAKRASFILSWRNPTGNTELKIMLKNPDGYSVSPSQMKSSDYYHIATFDFPLFQHVVNGDRTWYEHRGVWEMVIMEENIQGSEVVYDASLLVDEAKLDYEFEVVKKDYGTGEAVLLTARVTEDETPVRTLDKAQVVVKRPKTGTGTFLSTHTVSKEDLDKDLHKHKDFFPSLVDKKTYILVQDAANRQKLAPTIETIYLYDDGLAEHGDQTAGDGLYSFLLKDTTIPGTYSFNFHIEGKTFRSGKFSRNRLVSTQVRVKKPSIEDTDIDMEIIERTGDFYTVRISVTPFDRFKNYLGPGYSRYVEITSSDGTFVKPVEDQLDGSYSRDLTIYDFSKDPNIRINVQGVDLYDDPLSCILKPFKRYSISAHVGKTFPIGNFNNNYNPGFSLSIDADCHITPQFSFVGLLGYHHFQGGQSAISDTHWINVSGNLKYEFSISPLRPFINGGLGLYIPKNGSLKLGFNIGLGLDYSLTPAWTIELGGNYHHIFTGNSGIKFLVPYIGLIFRF